MVLLQQKKISHAKAQRRKVLTFGFPKGLFFASFLCVFAPLREKWFYLKYSLEGVLDLH